jgi:hypothetical protein
MFKTKSLIDSGKALPLSSAPTEVPGWPSAASAVAIATCDTRIAWYLLRHSLVFVSLGCILLASSAHADIIIYNDTTHAGGHVLNGGATEVSGDDITNMIADDITVAPGYAGATISSFAFAVASFAAVTADVIITFYSNNGPGGGPGTVLDTIYGEGFTFASGFYYPIGTGTLPPSLQFGVPASGTFWAALTFTDDNGTTGATAAQLNELGVEISNPVAVGSSNAALYFEGSGAADFSSPSSCPSSCGAVNNPAGTLGALGTGQAANFYWGFTTPTPEPGTGMLSLLAALPLAAGFIRRRRATKG